MAAFDPAAAGPDAGNERLCPSARCEEGALLLGIVGPNGTVGFISPPMRVDAGFVARAHLGRAPERRFRFVGRCVEDACRHWTGHRCGVIDAALAAFGREDVEVVRPCAIRPSCRWFGQHGRAACGVCPLIVTEVPGGEADRKQGAA
jgi:hypothetical protein